ncbi:IclR family transcriptional regulator [Saxibacter everestensis]|uniref:IclR family transcriptional regulator n=1 Tax=Saxibacter everestensis TaxID=2909229 RepID=A0ABY8QT01_9MICO|nr:IclR family transcriptional regulator [Brevibacteriaceae bacterium ZFBP1038]
MTSQGFGTDRATPPGLLQTADRALLVLLGFDRNRHEWGVTEVAAEFGWDKSIAQRVLATLAHRGFLVGDSSTRRYRIGPAAMQLGRIWDRSGSLRVMVEPLLAELSALSRASALLAVPDNFHMRCVAAVDGPTGPLRYYPLVGELYPAHAGATSKAYFAFISDEERVRLFRGRPMARFTDRTVVEADELEEQFQQTRQQDYCFTVGEYDAGVATLAVPLRLHGEIFGSVSLGGAEEVLGEPTSNLSALRDTAEQIERRLTGPLLQKIPAKRRR